MKRAFALSLGGNLGKVQDSISRCVQLLKKSPFVLELRVSSLYKTAPWGDVNGGDFLNAAVAGMWLGTDKELLLLCRSIEAEFSVPVKKNSAARVLDVDVLFLQNGQSTQELTVPHPRMTLRKFVLVPLCEVWSEDVPGLNLTPLQLLKRVQDTSSIIFQGNVKLTGS